MGLGGNNITDAGLRYLTDALSQKSKLECLGLSGNHICKKRSFNNSLLLLAPDLSRSQRGR